MKKIKLTYSPGKHAKQVHPDMSNVRVSNTLKPSKINCMAFL